MEHKNFTQAISNNIPDTIVRVKIQSIISDLGISGKKAAEYMGVSYTVFRLKNSNALRHSFNQGNLDNLIKNISNNYPEILVRYK